MEGEKWVFRWSKAELRALHIFIINDISKCALILLYLQSNGPFTKTLDSLVATD